MKFKIKNKYIDLQKKNMSEDNKCHICGKTFSRVDALKHHLYRTKYPCNLECRICKEVLSTKRAFGEHMEEHEDRKRSRNIKEYEKEKRRKRKAELEEELEHKKRKREAELEHKKRKREAELEELKHNMELEKLKVEHEIELEK